MDIVYVQSAEVLPEYVLRLTFENGLQANVDFGSFPAREGVFAKLNDQNYFKSVDVVDGALTWGNGELDIAPETRDARGIGIHEAHGPTGQ